jgi:hypothetical protein
MCGAGLIRGTRASGPIHSAVQDFAQCTSVAVISSARLDVIALLVLEIYEWYSTPKQSKGDSRAR